jgi:nuclear pore complex protein Nup93
VNAVVVFSATNTAQRNNTSTTMSLFGNLGGAQPASGGATAGKSLFGALPSTGTGTTTGGLFGGLGGGASNAAPGPSQPASTGGLGGSLFGGSLGAKPAATSLFPPLGATAAAQPQAQTQTGGFSSLFSKPAAPQQATLGNQQQTGGLGQAPLFSTAATQQQPQQHGPLSQSTAGGGRSAHFDHLLERGRKRNAGENGGNNFDELPSLQLGLGDIARKVRNLGAGGPSAEQGRDGAQDRAA